MPLPVPNLDDRRFQDLVDDAKRLVQRRCPDWSDHNVSDPGVTLIETFAYITDQLLYRINQVPDLDYIKFLELIGVRLFPPAAARTRVTFWLSAVQQSTVAVPSQTQVAALHATDEAVIFTTAEALDIVPCTRELLATDFDGVLTNRDEQLHQSDELAIFDTPPKPGNALLIGLSDPVPSCAIGLHFEGEIEGHGVDPTDPPLRWEAFDGDNWHRCEVDHDETGGLNRTGEIVLHVPSQHRAAVINRRRAGWVRCRVTQPNAEQPFYNAPPRLRALDAYTIGGTVDAVHAELVEDEIVGLSEGIAGQRFQLRRAPVVPTGEPLVLDVAAGSGWDEWAAVDNFADSGPDDRHFVLDLVSGEIVFGPAVRLEGGAFRQYGAIPPKAAPLRIRRYWTGGGKRGNVARGAISGLRTAIQCVARVENRRPATGGVEGESLENAKERGPIALRTKNRAVTAEDYEYLTRIAAPEIARVRCVPAGDGADAAGVRVLVVPATSDEDEFHRLRFAQLDPTEAIVQRIAADLGARRCVGARVVVEPPLYQGVTIVARIRASANTAEDRLHDDALAVLFGYYHPLRGGPDGEGWPFGRPVLLGEIYSVLQRVKGLDYIEDAGLFAADVKTRQRGEQTDRIELQPNELVFSFDHQVLVMA